MKKRTFAPLFNQTEKFRGVAQLVAHLVWDQVVARSSRVTPTKGFNTEAFFYIGSTLYAFFTKITSKKQRKICSYKIIVVLLHRN